MIFVNAGHATTANALTWTLYHLAVNPEWATAARNEVLTVVGPTRVPTYDEIANMPIVAAVINESMRLLPAVPGTGRIATRDVILRRKNSAVSGRTGSDELHIKAGTVVGYLFAAAQRDPALWEHAEEFNPRRFMGGIASALSHPLAYAPFGAGSRNCIGQHFALLEARLILATLLQRSEWELAPSYVHAPMQLITMSPKHGMPMRLRRRTEATTC